MDLNVLFKPQGPESRRTQPSNCQGSDPSTRQRSVYFRAWSQDIAQAGNNSKSPGCTLHRVPSGAPHPVRVQQPCSRNSPVLQEAKSCPGPW